MNVAPGESNGGERVAWYRVLAPSELPEGRVTAVAAGPHSVAITHFQGQFAALANRCPHQGGPLGEGSIEKGMLRCPWHGYDYCPLDGSSAFGEAVPTFPIEIREDGIYVGVEPTPVHAPTVSDVMAETMVNWGITHVFGMVGHSNLGLADALRRQEEAGRLTYIGIRHEGAAAFAASAYGKLTGRPAAHHAELMTLACKHALLQHGPAHLIFPDEVQTLPAPASAAASGPEGRIAPQRISPSAESLERAVALLGAAKRPVVIAGHGARFERDAVIALAERLGAPVITTFKAKGQIPDDHPFAAGVVGRSGTPVASWFMNEADALLVLGASFSDHTGIYAGKPIVQVDIDPLQLGRVHPVEVPVWGDIGVVVDQLCADLPPRPGDAADQRAELAERWAIWRAEKASRAGDDRGHGVNSAAVFAALSEVAPEGAVIAVDVGNHAYSFGRYFECKSGQSVLMSGYLGSIGFGYPAAIGAWAAAPGRPIFAVTGDGGFAQYMAELLTAVKHDMNITHVLLNNGQLGKISKEQRAGEWKVWQTTLHNPDFAQYAEICGALGIKVTEAGELPEALARAAAHDGPALVEVISDPDLI